DGVEPVNVDGYDNDSGSPLTGTTQLDYIRFLAAKAHARGLAIGLKNAVDQLDELVYEVEVAVNEPCHAYVDCDGYAVFIARAQPVFNAEYADAYVNHPATRQAMCDDSLALNIRTLVLPLDLDDSFRLSCDS